MRPSLIRTALVLPFAIHAAPLAAQSDPGPRPLCWRAAPKPACRVVILTNFGLYAIGGARGVVQWDPVNGQPIGFARPFRVEGRVTGDWGLLVNLGQRDAVGVSLFGSLESLRYGHQSELGLFARYRRWFGNQRSLDLALGMLVMLRNADALRSPYGLVKLNLNPWLGLALRPELRRAYEASTAPPTKRSTLFLSAGVEMGEKPGFALSALGAAILGVRTLIAIHRGS